jgi:hypothetical protein
MKEKFNDIVNDIEPKIEKFGFVVKAKDSFVRKNADKEEKIALSYRRGKGVGFENTIYISAMANITFSNLNKEEKKIINDSLKSYPIIGGSAKHFYDEDPGYLSIAVDENSDNEEVVNELMFYIENGAFKLFEKYNSLKEILNSIENEDKHFDDFHKFLDFRNAIRLATIKYIVESKDVAISWFENLKMSGEDLDKKEILDEMKSNWK